jgi:hypothetical protein
VFRARVSAGDPPEVRNPLDVIGRRASDDSTSRS